MKKLFFQITILLFTSILTLGAIEIFLVVKNKFIMDDPKKLFAVWKNDYKELYTYDLKNNDDLDYLVLMMKQKFDS